MANIKELKDNQEHNMFRGMWWWLAFRYFESNVPGPLPQKYSLPLPAFVINFVRRKTERPEGER